MPSSEIGEIRNKREFYGTFWSHYGHTGSNFVLLAPPLAYPADRWSDAVMSAIQLNDRWRVRLNDPAQWILEYRLGRPARKSTGYTGRSYCTQRRTLLRDIHDYCGDVDPNALAQVETLPERFPYRAARRA